jgi:hypothetical protein
MDSPRVHELLYFTRNPRLILPRHLGHRRRESQKIKRKKKKKKTEEEGERRDDEWLLHYIGTTASQYPFTWGEPQCVVLTPM